VSGTADLADGRRVVVEVPASSANLGAGFDCIGLALGIVNLIELEVCRDCDGRIELRCEGEGTGELDGDRRNRFVEGLETGLGAAGAELPPDTGWRIRMINKIPLSRGLGSSAAATVGGLIAANALAGGRLGDRDILQLATAIEGHPDNAAAALLGGFVVATSHGPGVEAIRFEVPAGLSVVLFIPDLKLSTRAMRGVLPSTVPFGDAVANLGRVAVGVAGMAIGRYELLAALTTDVLHEPYRATAFPQLPTLVAAARAAGAIGACLSGAGSSILAFADSADAVSRTEAAFQAAAEGCGLPGRTEIVLPRNAGARVEAIG
jgi:homoserine kinase